MELQESVGCLAIVCGTSNSPLLTFLTHVLAAIAYGNSVVVVVDERSPFPVMDLYEVNISFQFNLD
jgi:aldehyde dehydrogenase (NAD+)